MLIFNCVESFDCIFVNMLCWFYSWYVWCWFQFSVWFVSPYLLCRKTIWLPLSLECCYGHFGATFFFVTFLHNPWIVLHFAGAILNLVWIKMTSSNAYLKIFSPALFSFNNLEQILQQRGRNVTIHPLWIRATDASPMIQFSSLSILLFLYFLAWYSSFTKKKNISDLSELLV